MNFSCGQQKGADIALHFNPRFDSGDKIVLNSFQQGKWAKEEHKHNMPFHKGEPFELLFTITPEAYQVGWDGGEGHKGHRGGGKGYGEACGRHKGYWGAGGLWVATF